MRPLLWIALAGCQQVFGLEDTVLKMADARIDAPGCADATFVDPKPVEGNFMGQDFDPHMSADPRELWFTRDDGTGMGFDIHLATRGGTGSFDTITKFAQSSSGRDFDANTTANGLVMIYVSARLGNEAVFETRRTAIGAAFSAPVLVQAIVEGDATEGADLSVDGLTIYYADGNAELHSVHRAALDQPWQAPSPVLATDVTYPSISPDELELFHMRDGMQGIYRRVRTSTALPFDGPPMLVLADAADPDIASDSMTLFYADGGIFAMTRTCN